jgi:hypothetical protein
LGLILFDTSQAVAFCFLGIGDCKKPLSKTLTGKVIRFEYSGLEQSGTQFTRGGMIHFSTTNRRCIAIQSVKLSASEIDVKANFCFEPDQNYIDKSAITEQRNVTNEVTGKLGNMESYYSARLELIGEKVQLEYHTCVKWATDPDFDCTRDWEHWTFEIRGNDVCLLEIPSNPLIRDFSCEMYSE